MPGSDALRPTVVVTRPAEQAASWVERLRAAGWPVLELPLIEIGPAPVAQTVLEATRDWSSWNAVMFVSPAAVRSLQTLGVSPPADGPRCWAPGVGTVRALCDWGVSVQSIDAPAPDAPQMDSEALWAVVEPQVTPGYRLLIVRGVSADGHPGRDWLSERCRRAGAEVVAITAYRRQPPRWDETRRAAAETAAGAGHIWFFSSSEAIGHLHALLPHARWGTATALATHPRIAEAARALGFGRVAISRPPWDDVAQALESLS